MKMKTAIKISTLSFLALALTLGACKKDENNNPEPSSISIVGTWDGYWTQGSSTVKHDLTVTFNANHTGRVQYSTIDVPCSWQLEGNKVTFDYYQSTTARFKHSAPVIGNKMTGTWGGYPKEDGSGSFELTKR